MHFLVIPKQRQGLTRMAKAEERHEQLLGHLMLVASKVAKQGAQTAMSSAACWHSVRCLMLLSPAENLSEGYRISVNDGPNGCAPLTCPCPRMSVCVQSQMATSSLLCCSSSSGRCACAQANQSTIYTFTSWEGDSSSGPQDDTLYSCGGRTQA